ncbi:MAG: L,D-transpeptidase family protein [Acidobacteria bacterium]|nr:L,D-transpeptidase family protein [Acidobacteriota bacterium]
MLLLGAALTIVWGRQSDNSKSKALAKMLAQSQQLVLVVSKDWNAVDGELRQYERASNGQAWLPKFNRFAVVVGRNGMAWGKGLHGDPATLAEPGDPIKKEGDGRAPAGIFKLSSSFGYAPKENNGLVKLPYFQATTMSECVDDVRSRYYNRLVQRDKIAKPDWKSAEQMRRNDELYRWGVVVDHNADKPEAGAGSCIFLHTWSGAGKGTAGCTAMEPKRIEGLLVWLDPKKNPVLVQLPQSEFERLRESLGLPR